MKNFKTKDFYLACVLLSNNFQLMNSEKDSNKNTVFFNFKIENNEDLKEQLIQDFLNQQCLVNVKKFTWAMKVLRNELNKY